MSEPQSRDRTGEAAHGERALQLPSLDQLKRELKHEQKKHFWRSVALNTLFFLAVVSAVVIILIAFLFPVVQLEGTSMNPSLQEGDVVVSVSGAKISPGDIIAFYHNNSIYVKRVIAVGGDTVDIDSNGVVSVNGERLEEPYLAERAKGSCDISLPYQVPIDQYFVLGDHRSSSVDSRHAAVGCVTGEMMLGRVTWRIWPLERFGSLSGRAE